MTFEKYCSEKACRYVYRDYCNRAESDSIIILQYRPLKKARKAVLGTLVEPITKSKKSFLVNYSLLETNRKGEVLRASAPGEATTFEAIVLGKHKV